MIAFSASLDRPGFSYDLAFEAGAGITALFGPSGAGKTTTLRLIAGIETPARGRIVIDGETVLDTEAGIDVPPHRRRIGMVFQEARLFPHLSVRSNLGYGRFFAPRRARRFAVPEVADALGITPLLGRRVGGLSGGERQRVALGRAILAAPRLLLLDEPLASLDAARKAEILPLLERLRDEFGVPMLYVSHDATEVDRLATRVIRIEGGGATGGDRRERDDASPPAG